MILHICQPLIDPDSSHGHYQRQSAWTKTSFSARLRLLHLSQGFCSTSAARFSQRVELRTQLDLPDSLAALLAIRLKMRDMKKHVCKCKQGINALEAPRPEANASGCRRPNQTVNYGLAKQEGHAGVDGKG